MGFRRSIMIELFVLSMIQLRSISKHRSIKVEEFVDASKVGKPVSVIILETDFVASRL
jgi:hypothetical protein